MNPKNLLRLITLVYDSATTYEKFVEFLFGEKPPTDHNFLDRADLSCIEEKIVSGAYAEDEINLRENPNPKGKVCLLVYLPSHYYLYKNIYRHLPEGEFVLDAVWIRRNIPQWRTLYDKLRELLEQEKVKFRILKHEDNDEEFFKKYDALVFNTRTYHLRNKKITAKKIRIMYGQSKDSYDFGPWLREFDAALTYGSYSDSFTKYFTKSIIVGNPRFDDWFSDSLPRQQIDEIRSRLDHDKKTVLYAPTHDTLSSLEIFQKEVSHILEKFNVMIRLHPNLLYVDTERAAKFKEALGDVSKKVLWVDDFTDLPLHLAVADIVVSDNSGVIFDTILAGKPLVLIDFLDEKYHDPETWQVRQYTKGLYFTAMTYPESIEQRIKKEKDIQPGIIVKNGESIMRAIKAVLNDRRNFEEAQTKLRDMLYSYRDGTAGKRVAESIQQIIADKNPGGHHKWGFLQYATAEDTMWEAGIIDQRFKRSAEISFGYYNTIFLFGDEEKTLDNIRFSVIIPTFEGKNKISGVMESLLNQTGVGRNEYEIIIIEDGSKSSSKEVIQNCINKSPDNKIVYVWYSKNRGPSFARNIGIKLARGSYIAFTDDDCIVPPDWLTEFNKSFRENPEVAGVGGWYEPVPERKGRSVPLMERYVLWNNIPWIYRKMKSAIYSSEKKTGNAANMCYRKSAIYAVGGFNTYFRYPSLEDLEMTIRMHKNKFSLLYNAKMTQHTKRFSLSGFANHFSLRGYANYLIFLMYPETLIHNMSIISWTMRKVMKISSFILNRHFSVPREFRFSYLFIFLAMIEGVFQWLGKFLVAIKVLQEKKDGNF